MSLSRSVVFALIVVAGLAAGRALIAGYADKPSAPAQVTCPGQCDGCLLQGTDTCCKTQRCAGCTCAQPCAKCCSATCEDQCAGNCKKKAPPTSCPLSGCGGCGMVGNPCAK